MPTFCSVLNCANRSDRDKTKSFFRLPATITHQGDQTKKLSGERRSIWLRNISRKNIESVKNVRVCSDHFTTGKPSALYDIKSVDWAPSLQMGHSKIKTESTVSVERKQRIMEREVKKKQVSAAATLLTLATPPETPCEDEDDQPELIEASNKSEECPVPKEDLAAEINNLRAELNTAKETIKRLVIDEDNLKGNNEKVKFYTGLPSFDLLMTVFNFTSPHVSFSHRNCLSKFQEFMIVLMRLRLSLSQQHLAYQFNVSLSTVSRVFEKWLIVLDKRLKHLILWPERHALRCTMPTDFMRNFGNKIAVIIDCFEVFIDTPSSFSARSITWSNYKHHNTVKFLIGITPQGSVSFISRAWGGRASDKFITEQCGILSNLLPGDMVLADRGFNIEESVGVYCAQLAIPAFTRGKPQLPALEVEKTRKIANVRIHVERVIGLVRNKFRIFKSTLPIEMLSCREGCDPLIDMIARVCCALTNLCPSVVPLD